MPFTSGLPFPIVLTILPLRSLPWPVAVQATHKPPGQPVQIAPLLVDDEQSSAVPYVQSAPGSLVSAFLVTSLSPVCGFDVFTTPMPQSIWSTREQRPPRMFTKKVGTRKPGWLQHPCVPRGMQPPALSNTQHPGQVAPGQPVVALVSSVVHRMPTRVPAWQCFASHPGIPAHDAFGFPHGTQTPCSHVGKLPAAPTVKTVWTVLGKGMTWPSAVTHGSWRYAPLVAPQSASLLHVPKRFAAEFVVQRFSPVVPFST